MCVTSIGFGNKLPVSLRVLLDIKPQTNKKKTTTWTHSASTGYSQGTRPQN